MIHVVEFSYAIGTKVRLLDLACIGTVTGCLYSSNGKQYQVVWYSDGQRRCEWLNDFEVEASRL